ncbi:hypothetical protein DVH24_038658 [Malus domestica]|uniref:Obg domain-containing protein n=1 Tax=Malus domestica TaxID=3750 RepID=A0A498KDE5_MALDO|nr:hypothetical protein DVH24_038658 [Malus domestica]
MWGHLPKPFQHIKTLRHSSKSPWISFFSYSYSDAPHKRSKLSPLQERRIVDRFWLYAKGGGGGSGCTGTHRSRDDLCGRPDGGDVILECSPTCCDFSGLQPHLVYRGGHGSSKNKIGTRGADKVAQVPIGTVIHLLKGETPCVAERQIPKDLDPWEILEYETEKKYQIQHNIGELTVQGKRVIIACGGDGGMGNVSVKVFDDEESSLRVGLPGSEAVLRLELKSIADVSLVEMPNAGKTTLLHPNLGNLNFEDFSLTVADIPRLIEGAHENQRTKVLAYVVDLASGLDGRIGIPPWEQLRDLVFELEYHLEGLSNRPSLIVANKIDEDGGEEVYEELERRVQDVSIFPVCAVLEDGVPEVKLALKKLVNGEISDGLVLDKITVG